jgi:CDP-diacylglycerol---glycerol-3-phosphate 3-phosphatidyltransferase
VTTGNGSRASVLAGLTYARVALVPVVMALVLVVAEREDAYGWAALVFGIAAVTDFLDGYLARRWEVTSTLGSFLDTTADKLLVTGALIALVAVDRVSPWIAAVIVGRELLILGLRGVVAAEGIVFPPSTGGRAKAVVQFVAIFLALLRPGDPVAGLHLDEWAMLGAAAITLASAAEYVVRFSSAFRQRADAGRRPPG